MSRISRDHIRSICLVGILVGLTAFFAVATDGLFTGSRNLSNLAIELSTTAVLALGMLLVIVVGHIDLAMGSGVGLAGAIAATLIAAPWGPHWAAPLAMAATVVGILALWTLMGVLVAVERIPAFIITLGGLLVFKGLYWLVIHSETVPVRYAGDNLLSSLTTTYLPAWAGWALGAIAWLAIAAGTVLGRTRRLRHGFPVPDIESIALRLLIIAQGIALGILVLDRFKGVPASFLVLAFATTGVWVLTEHTRFGRWLYATGSNEAAALLSGVPVRAVVIGAFILSGVAVAITGFLQTAYAGSATTTTGDLMELDAVAACVIGGVSLKGGRGTVAGVLFGALLMVVLINGMTLMAVPPEAKYIVRGLVLALAVWMDVRLQKR